MTQASALTRFYFILFSSLLLLGACASAPTVDDEAPTTEATTTEPAADTSGVPPELVEQIEFLRLLPPENLAPPPPENTPTPPTESAPISTSLDRRIASDSDIDSASIAESLASARAQAEVESSVQAPSTEESNTSLEQSLQSAETALANSDYQKLRSSLVLATTFDATPEQRVRWRILQARLAMIDNDLDAARTYLSLDSAVLRSIERKWQARWFGARADYYARSGNNRLALRLRIELDRRLQAEERIANQRHLVVLLQSSSRELLQSLADETQIEPNRGWYELGKVLVANQDSLILRSIALNSWRQDWFNHPASANLDKLLVMENDTSGSLINNIGVILPLSGQLATLGEAVQTGINLAATEYVFQTGRVAPQISYYDSATTEVGQLYGQAVSRGAQLVIGPLLKQEIAAINALGLSAPVLALNYLDDAPTQNNLFQLGLAMQDEVLFISEAAWGAGCLNALVLYSDSEWSQRAYADFSRHWNRLGGVVLDAAQVSKDSNLARIISRLVQVDDAQVEQAKSFFNRELNASEYEEFRSLGRRSDAECLFLLVPDDQARLIRPLLAFYLANDLVTYGTSRINRPEFSREQNKDLDGIYWSDIPWLSSNGSTRQRLQREPRYEALRPYERLVALGVDAFNMFPYLTQMRANPNLTISASTGELRLAEQQQVRRQPKLMRFVDGDLTIVE